MPTYLNPLDRWFLDGIVEERPTKASIKQNYIGLQLMPMREVDEWEVTWDVLKAENNLAGIYAKNGRPTPGDDVLFSQMFADVVNVMASRILKQSDVMTLREPGEPSVMTRAGKSARQRSMDRLRSRIEWCDDAVDAQIEYLIMRALQFSVVWPPVDGDGNPISTLMPHWGDDSFTMNVAYQGVSADGGQGFNQAASSLTGWKSRTGGGLAWTNSSANPILDLEVISEYMAELKGLDLEGATVISGRDVLSRIAFNTNVINWVVGSAQGMQRAVGFVDVPAWKSFIRTKFGLNWKVYNSQWTYISDKDAASGPTINRVKFLDRGKLIIIPPGEDVGQFLVAPHVVPGTNPPEYVHGKYTWEFTEPEPPVETRVGVGLVGFPVFKQAESVFLLDVFN